MHVIKARNVNNALHAGLHHLRAVGITSPSRNGGVNVAPTPVMTVYYNPEERVLFSPERDANPFFHLFESLWMLAGRDDLKFLTDFVKRFKDFSDDGETLAGAYGYRWRKYFGFDQLERVITLLRNHPNTRRAVISMWDPVSDLHQDEMNKDIPCNSQVYIWSSFGRRDEPNRLNITVMCRSNDIIWGAYGANAVHFSVLQEYIATKLGLVVGTLYQLSNNFHAYHDIYMKTYCGALAEPVCRPNPYEIGAVTTFPIMANPETWDRDLLLFLEDPRSNGFDNPWFHRVAKPMWWAHQAVKRQAWDNALEILEQCKASDWRRAASEWVVRRQKNWKEKKRGELGLNAAP